MDKTTSILIVGAGAFGTSTAYHLSQRGYTNVRVLDRHGTPSADAASTDISKIVRADYNEPLYARLGLESIAAWETSPLFAGLYHKPGWVLAAKELSVPFVEGSIRTCERLGVKGIERLTPQEIRRRWPMFTGEFDGWNTSVWNPTAGWVAAGEALHRMACAAQDAGVKYITGAAGHMDALIYNAQGICTGIRTHDGTTHTADVVLLATGAWTPSLLDCGGQLTAKGHSVAHIQLAPHEAAALAHMPILDNLELGYFFPPTPAGVFKMAHSIFITNTRPHRLQGAQDTSVPHTFVENPADGLPVEIEATMRRNLKRVLPELTEREFVFTRLCWDADTADRHFLVAGHPTASSSTQPQRPRGLFLATGGSAHGFKFLPVLGKYVVDMLEGSLDAETRRAWAWRVPGEGDKSERRTDLAHMDPEMELRDLTGWRGRRARETRVGRL